MSPPKVSIVLVNWNNFSDTVECIESLLQVTYMNYEIVVIDNCSQGADAIRLREKFRDNMRLIENDRNVGFAEGCNTGIKDALSRGSDYIVLLNNDTVVAPDFLDTLLTSVEKEDRVGIAGGKVYCYEIPDMIWSAGGVIDYRTGGAKLIGSGKTDKNQFEELIDVDFVSGCFMLISRKVLEDIGLLDKIFFFGWEDADLCLRAKKRGYRVIFVPGSKIWHKAVPSEKLKRLKGITAYHATKGQFIFYERHFTRSQLFTANIHYFIRFPRLLWNYSHLLGQRKVPLYMIGGILSYLGSKFYKCKRFKVFQAS